MDSANRVRADLHCHSSASARSLLGVQRKLGLPECVTDPHEAYDLARARGMDFVTLTDHDTIEGALELVGLPGFFVSEELTVSFAGEGQGAHVLCWGIDPDDHARLQERAGDVVAVASYLHDRGIACALAHPFHDVAEPLTPRHRRVLAELFGVWEVRNGSRARDLNAPAVLYAQTGGIAGVAGSDDHAGTDIGRTWTSTPCAVSVEEFLGHLRAGRTEPGGAEGGAAKWAHAAICLAARSLRDAPAAGPPDPLAAMRIASGVVSQGSARSGEEPAELSPADSRALLGTFLESVGLEEDGLLSLMQEPGFRHEHLERRARREHERRLASAARELVGAARGELGALWPAMSSAFTACVPALPYVVAEAMLSVERRKARGGRGEAPGRVALVADGLGTVHGVSRLLERVRDMGVPRFEVEVVGTDSGVDRRLPSVCDIAMPFYEGLEIGVPAVTGVAEALAEGQYDLVHVATPGPAGIAAALVARLMDIPVVVSHHTELGAYAAMRSGDAGLASGVDAALGLFYRGGAPRAEPGGLPQASGNPVVLSPSDASDAALVRLGVEPSRLARWGRGVDTERFRPREEPAVAPFTRRASETITVLYAGRVTEEKGAPLLADAFLAAHARDPRLRLVVAGGGPEEGALADRLGGLVAFRGWLDRPALAAAYAGADIFCFASTTDTFGQVILEAQASGVPVVAAAAGGPLDLIEHEGTGLLCEAEPEAMAAALLRLAGSPGLRERLAREGVAAARARSWSAAMEQLARGYERALDEAAPGIAPAATSAPEQALEQAAA